MCNQLQYVIHVDSRSRMTGTTNSQPTFQLTQPLCNVNVLAVKMVSFANTLWNVDAKVAKKQPTWTESLQQTILQNLQIPIKPQKKSTIVKKRNQKYDYKGLINDRPHITIIAGKKHSGKSYLCCKLLLTSWRFQYDRIIFVSPTFRSQYDSLWHKLSPEGIQVHEFIDESVIQNLMDKLSNDKKRPRPATLLVLDDLGEEFRKFCPRVVNMLVSNSRHFNLSVVCLHQRLTQSPPIVRANADCIIAFSLAPLPK
jgi:hypothetical protein